ncbi:MAG: DNA-formamidopyrimidine glycosylase family protein [Planctomycetota bacterium]
MPEGDTLHRIAGQLRPVLAGETIAAADARPTRSVPAVDAASLVGRRVAGVEAVGKHLMIALDDGRAIHSHLGMTGAWHVYDRGEAWKKPADRAALVLSTATHTVVHFSPKQLELVAGRTLRRDPYLQRLGPDLMLPDVDLAAVVPRLRVHDAAPIGEAVMNQTIAAGIGNVYKSETLFLAKINPWLAVRGLSDEQLGEYLSLTHKLMRRNRTGGKRTTRFAAGGGRLWVYGRRGDACYVCGATVLARRQGEAARNTFWCPRCQPGPGPTPSADAQRRLPPIKGCS